MTRRQLTRAMGVARLILPAGLLASCDGGPESVAQSPTTPTAAVAEPPPASAGEPGELVAPHAAQTRKPPTPFWDEVIPEAIRKQKAHIAHIEALVRSHGMPEADIEALIARKHQHLEEHIARLLRMKDLYPF